MTQALKAALTDYADTAGCLQLAPIIDRLDRPVRLAVRGRAGVGGDTVARSLRQRGLTVVPEATCDVLLLVVAEVVKPEDLTVLQSARRPALVVLAKADLVGSGPGGPMAVARRRAEVIATSTGWPTVPMVGLLAALEPLDDEMVAALRSFVTEPADLTSVDAFLDGPHPVGRAVRGRLLERLDRFGIAHAVLALGGGTEPAALTGHLRRLGGLEGVLAALQVAAAPVGHHRIRAALTEIRSLAVALNDDEVAALAVSDAAVLAAMAAAVEVVEAAGLSVDPRDSRDAHVARAIGWRRYGRGPVNGLHGRCAADIVTGSLRLLAGPSG